MTLAEKDSIFTILTKNLYIYVQVKSLGKQ